jgi:gamma-glutamyl:cysteine ligase YbdK (ATP-grasp superfamily)
VGKEIASTRFASRDFKRFAAELEKETCTLEHLLVNARFAETQFTVGFELEACLLDRDCFPVAENERFLERLSHPLVVPELSRFNVELNGTPQQLTGGALSRIEAELEATWRRCLEVGHDVEATLIMTGILPTLRNRDLTLANISPRNRYYALNEQILRRRAGRPLRVDVAGRDRLQVTQPDVMLEAATTSFQVHLQAPASEIARYYNASVILSAPLVALSANSPFLFGKSLWDETRVPVFEQAVATDDAEPAAPRRVTLGSGYLTHPRELFRENIELYPVLLPMMFPDGGAHLRHLRLHNGTIWRWNRLLIGFDESNEPTLRIEHRVMPAGPTVADMFANAAVYVGAARFLAGLRQAPEDDLEFETARENFYRAARDGLAAELTWLGGVKVTARELLADELLHMAREGLVLLGIDRDDAHRYLDLVRTRTRYAQNGASWQRAYVDAHGRDFFRLTADYLAHQRTGLPVHEWPI